MSGVSEVPAAGLKVESLAVESDVGIIVHPLDFTIAPGRSLAIIGESGSGKSMTARALTGLLPRGVRAEGTATIDDFSYDLAESDDRAWGQVRGSKVLLLLQDPFTSLSPVVPCGRQIEMTIQARITREGAAKLSKTLLAEEVNRRLEEVRLAPEVAKKFPFELSGGMRQRVAIAAALAAEPRLLIADEPTTALDASTQSDVLDLLRELQQRHEMRLILISHDLGVVLGRADELMVMRAGEVVERGVTAEVLNSPQHSYTRELLKANLSVLDSVQQRETPKPILEVRGVSKQFGGIVALSDANIEVGGGEILAIVGESGSGKSTLARCITGLEQPELGEVVLEGKTLSPGRRGRNPEEMQIVFQDPYSTLNPVFTVEQALNEALRAAQKPQYSLDQLLDLVELDRSLAGRRPSQLSGGQRQRVAIARALAPNPRVLICDESVSALDVSVQQQILVLLTRLRDELGLAMLFITHDLGVVAKIANRAVVLHRGVVVERGSTDQILRHPTHPYTQMLVAAAERDSIDPGSAVSDAGLPTKEFRS